MERPRILLVCTGNQCRSPMAEGLLRSLLAARGVDAVVDSAGTMDGGYPATRTAVEVLASRGIDIRAHQSRHVGEVDPSSADLIIGMERRHLTATIDDEHALASRAFTIMDLVRRAEAHEARRPDEALRAWAERLAAGRPHSALLGIGDDEVADPIGRPSKVYEATADTLADLLARLVQRAWPDARSEVA